MSRERELAEVGARDAHIEASQRSYRWKPLNGHSFSPLDEDFGFSTCPHPDCVLVRTPPELVTSRQIAFDHAGVQQWGDDVPCWIYAGKEQK